MPIPVDANPKGAPVPTWVSPLEEYLWQQKINTVVNLVPTFVILVLKFGYDSTGK